MDSSDIRLTVSAAALDAGAVLVTVAGEIDGYTAADFYIALRSHLDSGVAHVVLEMADVSFIDSAGLRALIDVNKAAKVAGVRLSFVRVTERIQRLFEMTTLDRVFDIHETATEATKQ